MIGSVTPSKPQYTRVNAYCDVAFRMVKLRRPLKLCKISGLTSIATLHPNCLRLTLAVTRQRPRLANGGLLDLTMRDFHLLDRAPFQGALNLLQHQSLYLLQNTFVQTDIHIKQEVLLL